MRKSPEVQTVCQSFSYCPACGLSRDSKTDPLQCSCGFRYYFNPASAVGALLTDGEGNLLFIRRGRDPGRGKLGLPGGFIDAGENAEEAVRREVAEEIGLQIGALRYLTSHPNTYVYGSVRYSVVDLFFVGELECLDSIQLDAAEVSEWFLARPETLKGDDFAFESNWFAVEAFFRRQFVSSGSAPPERRDSV